MTHFFAMKKSPSLALIIAVILTTLTLASCTTPSEYSNLPWTEQQPWEGSRQIPGMTPGY